MRIQRRHIINGLMKSGRSMTIPITNVPIVNEFALRVRSNLRLKLVLGAVLTGGIWGTYLFLQRHVLFPVTAMQPTALDRMVPFVPGTVYLYESLWLLMPIAPWLMSSREEVIRYARGLSLISLAGFAIFILYPTSCPRPREIPDNALYRNLISFDLELHAFPSLHAAFAVFHGACCHALFRQGVWRRGVQVCIWLWVAGIVVSTLLTRQHVILDVLAGILLGWGGYALCCRSRQAGVSGQPAERVS